MLSLEPGESKDADSIPDDFSKDVSEMIATRWALQESLDVLDRDVLGVGFESEIPEEPRAFTLGGAKDADENSFRFRGSISFHTELKYWIRILFDSGAKGNFVSWQTLKSIGIDRLQLEPVVPPLLVDTGNGAAPSRYRVSLRVNVGGCIFDVECLVMERMGEQLILGREIFAKCIDRMKKNGRFLGMNNQYLKCIPDAGRSPTLKILHPSPLEDPKRRLSDRVPEVDDLVPQKSIDEKNAAAWSEMVRGIANPKVKKLVEKFKGVFTEALQRIPETRGKDDCVIPLYKDHPGSVIDYGMAEPERELARETIDHLRLSDTIEPSTCRKFLSPLLFVKKGKDGKRMCIDYRGPNGAVRPHPGTIPLVSDMLRAVAGHEFITALDLTSAFHQQRIAKGSRDVTTFKFEGKYWRFKLLPFGLVLSPTIMQETVAKLFEGIPNVLNYIDDIVIFSHTLEEHLSILTRVFQRLVDKQFYLKASKCEFARALVKFLGYQVLKAGIALPDDRMKDFRLFAVPPNPKAMQRALGVFNYFRDFLPNYAKLARPLQDFAMEPPKSRIDERTTSAFQTLIEAFADSQRLLPVLKNAPFVIQTDASGYATGAVLYQQVRGRTELYGPIAIMSKSLDKHQQMYPVRQKELLAVVLALEKWRNLVMGRPVTVFSDHQSLSSILLTGRRPEVQRIANWVEKMLEFDIRIKYLSGEENELADFLSREIAPSIEELYRAGLELRIAPRLYMMNVTQVDPLYPPVEAEEALSQIPYESDLFTKWHDELQAAYKSDRWCKSAWKRWHSTSPEKRVAPAFRRQMRHVEVVGDLLFRGGEGVCTSSAREEDFTEVAQ